MQVTSCELLHFGDPVNLKKLGEEKKTGGQCGSPVFVDFSVRQDKPGLKGEENSMSP